MPKLLSGLIFLLAFKISYSQTQPISLAKNNWAWQAIGINENFKPFVLKRSIKIAVIDDGFDVENPLWINNIAINPKEIPGNNIDDDNNGKIDDYKGWDFGDNDEDVKPDIKVLDKEMHGTKVLGVLWQALQQCAGLDLSKVSILPIKAVSDTKMNNYVMEGYKGIAYAIEQKADIIICSWSGPNISEDEKAIVQKAAAKGIIIIASAGNFYALTPQYPGGINSVISVAATDKNNQKLKASNYGMFIDISAPGDSLLTYFPYKITADTYLSATSAATPITGAVVAAMYGAYPLLNKSDIEKIIKNTAQPLDSANALYAGNLGAGLINVSAIKNEIENRSSNKKTFYQPKAYINLQNLDTNEPVKIIPSGKYKSIKFLLQTSVRQLPNVRVKIFFNNLVHDSIIKKDKLKYPFIVAADSIYIYSASAKLPINKLPSFWYYEVATIDSSTLYCSNTVTIKDTEGYIEDGSGNNNYAGRSDCKWQLIAPAGKRLQLSFDEFDTEAKTDQVYIFNGTETKDPILAIFSGPNIPPSITSWGNEVLLWFLTSEQNNFKGWKLHYKVID